MRAVFASAVASMIVVGFGACGSSGYTEAAPGAGEELMIRIENQNYNDATVYTLMGSRRQRLGDVASNDTRTFSLVWNAPRLRLEVSLLAEGSYRTEEITVIRGDVLNYIIPPDAHRRVRR